MAVVVGGLGISHTPSMGIEYDKAHHDGASVDPRWEPWFTGASPVREALADLRPDHLVVVYNDHLNHFTLDELPSLAIGVGESFPQADEGWGHRQVADLTGDVEWGLHLVDQLVEHEFDPTVCLALTIDHGVYSWFPFVFDQPWPVTITPIAVNMVCQPIPKASRLCALGRVIGVAVGSFPRDDRVVVVATGGMSHQISGARFGIGNPELDRTLLELLPRHLDELAAIPTSRLMELGGTEAAELTLWYAMRAALSADAEPVYSVQTHPSITSCGALVMREPT
jgi:protocatechuate 4,5-dioxygenase beta chain